MNQDKHHRPPQETPPAKDGLPLQSSLVGLEFHQSNGTRIRVKFPSTWGYFSLTPTRRGWYPFGFPVVKNRHDVFVDGALFKVVEDVVEIEKVHEVDRILDGELSTVTTFEPFWAR